MEHPERKISDENIREIVVDHMICMDMKKRNIFPQNDTHFVFFKDKMRENNIFLYRREGAEMLRKDNQGTIECAAPTSDELIHFLQKIMNDNGISFNLVIYLGNGICGISIISGSFILEISSCKKVSDVIAKGILKIYSLSGKFKAVKRLLGSDCKLRYPEKEDE